VNPPISIVIPCKDDPEIMNCIRSIDYSNADIEIILNGTPESFYSWLVKELKSFKKVHIHRLPKPNLSWALEYGTQHAKNDLVLYMDSDCRFKKGAVQAFAEMVIKHDPSKNVFKGDVVFEEGHTYLSRVISESRTHHTAEVLTAYKPPLMVSKAILPKIGGYAFNVKLIWREDSDLDNRIRQASINILHVPAGVIYHHTISLKTDLRSTFRYGIGLAIANVLHIKLTEVPRSTASAFKSKGLVVALYMLCRNRIYDAGYVYARVRLLSKAYLDGKVNR
jgi:glycosyltransferase involved in cell wall biosynthesis